MHQHTTEPMGQRIAALFMCLTADKQLQKIANLKKRRTQARMTQGFLSALNIQGARNA